jgi:hypothetical protein
MTTPSGTISLNDVNVELGLSGTTTIQMNQANVRTLAGVGGSGTTISMNDLRGKSNRVTLSYTFSSNTANASLNLSAISGYISGKSDITVTVNSGVYLYATSTGGYGLNLSGATTGDTLTIVNNGFIMGQGGNAGISADGTSGVGNAGGPALNLNTGINPTITNTSGYIAGGGGGGASGYLNSGFVGGGGGGGAGGGNGSTSARGYAGGSGGSPGSTGNNGTGGVYQWGKSVSGSSGGGGGGGRIIPGSGGSGGITGNINGTIQRGVGGGAGGGGGAGSSDGGAGGGSTSSGSDGPGYGGGGGGGGGWGAAGGKAANASSGGYYQNGGSGGKGINLNGKSITWTGGSASSSRVYGAVS